MASKEFVLRKETGEGGKKKREKKFPPPAEGASCQQDGATAHELIPGIQRPAQAQTFRKSIAERSDRSSRTEKKKESPEEKSGESCARVSGWKGKAQENGVLWAGVKRTRLQRAQTMITMKKKNRGVKGKKRASSKKTAGNGGGQQACRENDGKKRGGREGEQLFDLEKKRGRRQNDRKRSEQNTPTRSSRSCKESNLFPINGRRGGVAPREKRSCTLKKRGCV